ncbi:ABC transporter ATP-binding protein [Thioclava atlantica]|uniref:ABC transporter ATP-binding protein n=1 Tax=Thioclava atlantica TaxID=1317124 RepID=UPI0005707E19|nr:ABC transporter ATP-binding protein [Thioclava atlantica]
MKDALLEVRDLRTVFETRAGRVCAVDGVSVAVRRGECLGIVGESGSGKSVTFASVMGLVKAPGRIESGTIVFDGRDLRGLSPRQMRAVRGRDMAMTMQDALTALNPALSVGEQIAEVLEAHDETLPTRGAARRAAIRKASVEMLGLVGIPSAETRLRQYPHEFSGGMRQRIMIAIALACRPKLLIADEPTTALDVTIQAQVLELISDIRKEFGMSVALITHDLGVVAEHCDRVMVMYAGQVVEEGLTAEVIGAPKHPYTQGLLASIPRPALRGEPIHPIEGQVPDLIDLEPQCRFYSRCSQRRERCLAPIEMRAIGPAHNARCILAGEEET